ncbi:tRNA (adenosine(37)-N6)-dimethylallyltransferase MiaA [Roseobacter sp. A03A-229]
MAAGPMTGTERLIAGLSRERPVLIAGPTASGKSALALEIAAQHGGVIVNADASQVYDCWRIVTARPSDEEIARAPHYLYGHIAADAPYSAGHWLREVVPLLEGARPIIVGGTGLYFTALTQGLADIPATPPEIRAEADALSREAMLADLDTETTAQIDTANRARVQRAWEVQRATGRSLRSWQAETAAPALPETAAEPLVFDVPKDWLLDRIARRFDQMLAQGALNEARAVLPDYDPNLPAHRAIGAPELIAHLRGEITLDEARDRAIIATRQFAKRQRTWFRSKMARWQPVAPE